MSQDSQRLSYLWLYSVGEYPTLTSCSHTPGKHCMALIPVADIGPDPRDDGLVVGQQRHSGVVAMHAHIKTTQRYAHLSDETLISAASAAPPPSRCLLGCLLATGRAVGNLTK